MLADDGYDAVSASNGSEALEILDRWSADLVVLDLMMPVMDGWTFAQRMREERRADVPIVILSAATDLTRHAATIRAAGVIPKPFDLDTLLPTIERAVGHDGGATAS